MTRVLKDFQIFAKPVGNRCNLACSYCYYLDTAEWCDAEQQPLMPEALLETYIKSHIDAYPGKIVQFSWHGGEPTLLGLDYFQRIVELQHKHCPPHKRVANGIQTNGTLLDDTWCRFLAKHKFAVGLSLDGPEELHDLYRRTRRGGGTHTGVMRGYSFLMRHGLPVDILCVVSGENVLFPLQVYHFFLSIGVRYLSFLPLVERLAHGKVSDRTVPAEAFGAFLCTIFDQWLTNGIGKIKIQIFEEAARTAFGQDHSLCLFRPTCGDIPVVEHNGDVYPCDHFVQPAYRIGNLRDTPLSEILGSKALTSFGADKLNTLPTVCKTCEVLAMCHGECPKNRFLEKDDEKERENYLCAGYKLFFTHCQPFIRAIAQQWQEPPDAKGHHRIPATGRNTPCPCGSGRKFKKCCGAG